MLFSTNREDRLVLSTLQHEDWVGCFFNRFWGVYILGDASVCFKFSLPQASQTQFFPFFFFSFFFLTDYSFYTTDQPSHFSVDFLYLSQTAVAKTRPGRILFVIEGLGGELMILAFTPHYKWLLLQKYAIINSRSACGWLVLNPCPLRSSHSVIIQLIFLSA